MHARIRLTSGLAPRQAPSATRTDSEVEISWRQLCSRVCVPVPHVTEHPDQSPVTHLQEGNQ